MSVNSKLLKNGWRIVTAALMVVAVTFAAYAADKAAVLEQYVSEDVVLLYVDHSGENLTAEARIGTESTDQAVSAMQVINDCIQSIKTLMDEIASASVRQSEMTSLVEDGIKEISAVVQDNTIAAEKSTSVSGELSRQAQTLNRLISRFRI